MNLQEQISRMKGMMGIIKEEDNMSISDMVKKDQDMREKEDFDVNIDFSNQKQLKKMIDNNPQAFLEKIDSAKDVEGVWLIAQHADNDLEFQEMILDLLKSNKDMLIKKFNIPSKDVLHGIAMLTDRVMINSTTSVEGYRDSGNEDFSKVSSGKQKYGTQGGSHDGKWIPRPIEMEGKKYFFKTPDELYKNKEFLKKINKLRNDVGLSNLEDYVKNMQKHA